LVSLAYYQASQIISFIESRYGFEKVVALFPHFRQGKKTEEVIPAVFGQSVNEFDQSFQDFLRDRFHPSRAKLEWSLESSHDAVTLRRQVEADPQNFFAHLFYGAHLAKIGQYTDAEIFLKKAKTLFPEYVDENNPYVLLANIYWKQNRRHEAVAELEYLTANNGKAFQEAVRLSEWQLALADTAAAARAIERALAIFPYDVKLQHQYGRLVLALRQPQTAVRVFRTVLALNPVDRADIYCWLAQAYLLWGQRQQAKKHALLALEIAPTFERAQEILLQTVE
jgi:predicted Zn-dependent protease